MATFKNLSSNDKNYEQKNHLVITRWFSYFPCGGHLGDITALTP